MAASAASILGYGQHPVRITRAKTGVRRGIAQVEVWLETVDGTSMRECVVITPKSIGRIISLTDAAGLPRPIGDDVEDPYKGKLSQSYCDRLVGRWVDMWVHNQPPELAHFSPRRT